MTKKDKIISTALELFANDGYAATSTRKVADRAGVSEGLVFRHFGSKRGLLDAILDEVEQKIGTLFAPLLNSTLPEEVIRGTLAMPFEIPPSQYDYWRLQFKLKWEVNRPAKMQPLLSKLEWAFAALDHNYPQERARLIHQILDAVSMELLRGEIPDPPSYRKFLLAEYAP